MEICASCLGSNPCFSRIISNHAMKIINVHVHNPGQFDPHNFAKLESISIVEKQK